MKKYLRLMIAAGLVFGLFFGLGTGLTTMFQKFNSASDQPSQKEEAPQEKDGELTNILVLGVDARPGEDHSRSDTMLLVSIDPRIDKAAIVSIPRDTRVNVKGSGINKICTANYVGGPTYAVELVEDLMDIKIDHYVEMDFNGFKRIVDILGGVTIDVPRRMYKPYEGIDLKPGKQRLDGKGALGFVRFRDYVMGDIERVNQQQLFLKALADEVLQAKTIPRFPRLVKEISKYVDTDIKLADALRMASWAPGFNSESIIAQTLPGYFYDELDENGNLAVSYWVADTGQAAGLLDKMFSGTTVAVMQEPRYSPSKRPGDLSDTGQGIVWEETEREKAEQQEKAEQREKTDQQKTDLPSPEHQDPVTTPPSLPAGSGPEGYM